jgi:hypothetical protein
MSRKSMVLQPPLSGDEGHFRSMFWTVTCAFSLENPQKLFRLALFESFVFFLLYVHLRMERGRSRRSVHRHRIGATRRQRRNYHPNRERGDQYLFHCISR